ncbi:GNAT family N-acetyltransferase [Ferrimonas lipolytica]|uniref:GNAT family N-acetyltransferase n=1 Tax=Ferrimonas lipolytica TaxID=2724191 RepID=A0A6H1UIW3_9GAMM|nr:GNAT family N-acetyltransferase [Ferrimonas lipolytica]QIZ78156.1 GNAT family N-acetyltransferase [Ferrimonas lipolytica]
MPGLEVARSSTLSLHQFDDSDAAAFKLMNDQPKVLEFTGDKPFASEAEAALFLRNYDHYQQHGFGRWSIYLHDGRYGGFCGLRQTINSGGSSEIDLGYRVPLELWGRGIATDAGRLALQLGFEQFKLPQIVAHAMPANPGSVQVLRKLGMHPISEFSDEHGHWQTFCLTHAQWSSR